MAPRSILVWLAICLGLGPGMAVSSEIPQPPWPAPPLAGEPLSFDVVEGNTDNALLRWGPVAAHALATSGERPRLVVAFPAENEGAALWFEAAGEPVGLDIEGPLVPLADGEGRAMVWGVQGTLRADSPTLRLASAVLGSVRTIRQQLHGSGLADELSPELRDGGGCVRIARTMLDRRPLIVQIWPLDGGACQLDEGEGFTCTAATGSEGLRLTFAVLGLATPLTPIPVDRILRPGVEADPRDLQALAFLAYEEKLLAGSWRFLTYFGRDTLLSVAMLMPVVRPEVTEAGLRSVLTRLDPHGHVAHEEDIGDWAALRRVAEGADPAALSAAELGAPIHDYKMIDDDFLLAPVAAAYLLDDPDGADRALAFLGEDCGGRSCGDALRDNLDLVIRLAEPFAADPRWTHLIALREGENTGEWRDSEVGLGGGRIPYNVNGILVPAALRAAARLLESPVLWGDTAAAAHARELAADWDVVASMFTVTVPEARARRRIAARARRAGLDPDPALAAVDGAVTFPALALDERGRPLAVMHSDDGFDLMFGEPPEERLLGAAERILRPFPAGLRTDAGIVVANASLAGDAGLRDLFTPDHYHGEVIWSWQQALLAAGLRRQLSRRDLPAHVRESLAEAQSALWEVIDATAEQRRAELWSWQVQDGQVRIVPFGQGAGHLRESNAVQLWSTVYLGVGRP